MIEDARTIGIQPRAAAWRLSLGVLVFGMAFGVHPRHARAESGQWRGGAGLGAAWLEGAGPGPALSAYVRHGLSASVDLTLQSMTSLHPASSPAPGAGAPQPQRSNRAWAFEAGPGIDVRWDVLQWIPYAGVGLAYYRLGGAAVDDTARAGSSLGAPLYAGVDYLLSRALVLNLQATVHTLIAPDGPRLTWALLTFGAAHAWGD
jgi:hypothetical protein